MLTTDKHNSITLMMTVNQLKDIQQGSNEQFREKRMVEIAKILSHPQKGNIQPKMILDSPQ